MTTNYTDEESDRIIARGLSVAEQMRERVKEIETARESQPERLAKARSAAEEARGWALLEEPLEGQVTTAQSVGGESTLALPSVLAKELWGARLCFDVIDAGDDFDQVDAIIARLFAAADGDTGIAMIIMAAALSTIASLVVPQLLQEIEHGGSNYDERVRLAEARAKAWHGRVSELRGAQDEATNSGCKPVDGFDIGASALDAEPEP